MVELALTLPVVLLLFFGVIEYARVLRLHQQVNGILREVAISSFRECRSFVDPSACTTTEIGAILSQAGGQIAAGKVIASWRRFDSTTVPDSCPDIVPAISVGTYPGSTRVNPAASAFVQVCEDQEVVLTLEAFVPYQGLFSGLHGLFQIGSGAIYATMVL